jgi:hypothetical protein
MTKKVDVHLDPEKLSRVAMKVFRLLVKKTRTSYEAYAVLLVLKSCFEDEIGLKETEFKSVVDDFSDFTGDFE